MEPDPEIDTLGGEAGPSEEEAASQRADAVQGFEEDVPTEAELERDDGYHPEAGGEKYAEADPVDEELLARQEGLTEDEDELLEEGG